jgi:hypothetical protein
MSNYKEIYWLKAIIDDMQKIQFVLSGFAAHLASHFARSFKNHSYGYACLNDRPNCIASYTAKSGSFVQYAGK